MTSIRIILYFVVLFVVEFGYGHRTDVYIAGFFPYGHGIENSETGRGVMPSVKLALDHVNEHSEVLRNYRLHMWWNDTQVSSHPPISIAEKFIFFFFSRFMFSVMLQLV